MPKSTDIIPKEVELYFLPVETRVPLKFGKETLTSITCARAMIRVENHSGKNATGWGETPLSVPWVWPGALSYQQRHKALKEFCILLARAWRQYNVWGHAFEVGHSFQELELPRLMREFNKKRSRAEALPYLAALVCCSLFDIALHDSYGLLQQTPVYATYNRNFMNHDLAYYLGKTTEDRTIFKNSYPADFLVFPPPSHLTVWHLVGGKDPLDETELEGNEPNDGHPVLLADWIRQDGLKCLKVKLRGNDSGWDYERLVKVGTIAVQNNVDWLCTDFNCTVTDPAYVNEILDKLKRAYPRIYDAILYVEQPFPYELEEHQINVQSLSNRKPLFMDESAHNWHLVKLGRALGWTGVALKTCKTQTGTLLTLCWAKAHDMPLMVQDLTNPMLAQISHIQLAAHAGTIMGIESNSMQFYPAASSPEAKVHPGIYQRRNGLLDLHTLDGNGFGYSIEKIKRILPASESI
jgi:L-alanine-DL-glutamate epimerase-like enolase superfamily enzyme